MRAILVLALAVAAASAASAALRSRSSAAQEALLSAASRGNLSRAIWEGGYGVIFGRGLPVGTEVSESESGADLVIPTAWGEVYLGEVGRP